ncbi:hypothetical protein FKM82_021321 [Ascaphus truei]
MGYGEIFVRLPPTLPAPALTSAAGAHGVRSHGLSSLPPAAPHMCATGADPRTRRRFLPSFLACSRLPFHRGRRARRGACTRERHYVHLHSRQCTCSSHTCPASSLSLSAIYLHLISPLVVLIGSYQYLVLPAQS